MSACERLLMSSDVQAKWINSKFSNSTDEELSILMKQKITKWGDEFKQEILIGSEGI